MHPTGSALFAYAMFTRLGLVRVYGRLWNAQVYGSGGTEYGYAWSHSPKPAQAPGGVGDGADPGKATLGSAAR